MSVISLLSALILGIALAASCGLRAFLPLWVVAVAARLGQVELGDAFTWLQATPCLVALSVGVAFELLADKIPLLNHLLDVLATPVRTGAGMLAMAATLVDVPGWVVALLAVIIGGGVALSVHVARSGTRLASSVATATTATPGHSLLEDIVCIGASLLSVLFWGVALLVAAASVALSWITVRTVVARWRRT